MRGRGSIRGDALAASFIFSSVLLELSIREAFHHTWAEVPKILGVFTLWSAMLLLILWIERRRAASSLHRESLGSREWVWSGPVLLGIAIAIWVSIVCEPWMAETFDLHLGPGVRSVVSIMFPTVGVLVAHAKLSEAGWSGLRRGISAAMVVFVLSQPLLAIVRAKDYLWPVPQSTDSLASAKPALQVFVLLDELNDKAAEPIIAAMSRSGQPVLHRALIPVASATAKVVPSLFTHEKFPDAKPCSLNTVCSGTQVLNFARIHATRPDIDVVGFYLPYCAIQGLRSCHVEVLESPLFSWDRWSCAFLRRYGSAIGMFDDAEKQHCRQLGNKVFSELVSDVEDRISRAQVWAQWGRAVRARAAAPSCRTGSRSRA